MLQLENLIFDAINEVIRNIFDDEVAEMLLGFLKENSSMSFEEKLRFFEESLPKILGSGAVIIEDLILETLYSKLGIKFEQKRKSFTEYVLDLMVHQVETHG
ncbi:hypothetical protein CW705_04460 [Candidatus Bathyarchaeota archaeon]|nr:MAG: hypothetical protein CW705_04460 [Candidatus Bathyarchaeota archaeon]RLE61944.1 MAG: hypothetical protein DRJ38_10525 [Thermoprotei archaeon]